MIKRLTAEQTARFPEYVKKWTDIGLSTEPADRAQAERGIKLAYQVSNLSPPDSIIWTTSPLALTLIDYSVLASVLASVHANVRANVHDSVLASVNAKVRANVLDSVNAKVRDGVLDSVNDSVLASVRASVHYNVLDSVNANVRDSVLHSVHYNVLDSVNANVRDSVLDNVFDSVLDSVNDSVRESVLDSVHDGVLASVRAKVRDGVLARVLDSVLDSVNDSVRDSVLDRYYWWFGNGQHDAVWISYINYMRDVVGLRHETERGESHRLICESAGWFAMYKNVCCVAERHTRLRRNQLGQLHSHDGMAVQYPDGWGVWAWNGVRVTEQMILRPETLTAEQIAKEKNAQVRQVMVERVGIERVCQMFRAQTLDTRGDYALLMLDLGDGRKRPYLKMLNPSVGVWHVEGVHPTCKTVMEALNWRNGLTPEQIDDVNGSDWIQQGDVILKPQGAQRFKSQPIQLT